jgi:Ice-binding-like
MKLSTYRLRATGSRATPAIWLLALGLLVALVLATSAAAATAVPLATADSFAVLAGAGITNTGPTTINGDVGTFPTTTIVGAGSMTINGTNHAGDAVTQGAQNDLVTAYNNAAGQGPTNPIAADLGGLTLTPGVYNSASSIGLTGALTLNGGGDPNAVFIFQAGSSLTTASGSQINLINGAQSCNVFWQVGSSATLGTGSTFRGTVIALTSITVTTAVTVDGRVLARNGAVTLDTDTIARSGCAAAAPTPAPAPVVPAPAPAPAPVVPAPVPVVPAPVAPKPIPVVVRAPKAAAVKAAAVRLAAIRRRAAVQGHARAAIRNVGLTG